MVQVEEAKGRVIEYDQQVSKVATLDSMTETNKQTEGSVVVLRMYDASSP